MNLKLNPKHYYRSFSQGHLTGDIWRDLPSLGLLNSEYCSGLVITPACDLANYKVETITYLPIISINEYFASRSFYPKIRSELLNYLKEFKLDCDEVLKKNYLPNREDINLVRELILEINFKKNGQKEKADDGVKLLENIVDTNTTETTSIMVKSFLGEKNFTTLCNQLIRNSYSNDLHFLPKDGQDESWSAIPRHSLILFRYPISAPIELFELANDPTCVNWKESVEALSARIPFAMNYTGKKPLKVQMINLEFLTDILTRFIGLYVRTGSPDFTNDTTQSIIAEI